MADLKYITAAHPTAIIALLDRHAAIVAGLEGRLVNHANLLDAERRETARLRARLGEVEGALARLIEAKDEKDNHGNTDHYHKLKAGAWERARAALKEPPHG